MTTHAFTNLDALWLAQRADDIAEEVRLKIAPESMFNGLTPNEVEARLRAIAANLQRMDEQNAMLRNAGDYDAGYAAAEARMRARSNILTNPEGEDARGAAIIDQIDRTVAAGKVKRYAMGERALDDAPDKFNARKRSATKPGAPGIDLDLSVLNDL